MQEFLRFIRHTVAFQRMAATELRLFAQEHPLIALSLQELANTVDEHADAAQAIATGRGKLEPNGDVGRRDRKPAYRSASPGTPTEASPNIVPAAICRVITR